MADLNHLMVVEGYGDLNVPLLSDPSELVPLLQHIKQCGFSYVALNQTVSGHVPNDLPNKAEQTISLLRDKHPQMKGPRLLSRVTVVLEDMKECPALSGFNPAMKAFDIIAVRPESEKLFHQSCSTLEVDIISLDFSKKIPYFVKGPQITQAVERGVIFEICYSLPLVSKDLARVQFFCNVLNLVRSTKAKNILLSSQAASIFHVRTVEEIICMATHFGMDHMESKLSMTAHARAVIFHAYTRRRVHKSVVHVAACVKGNNVGEEKEDEAEADNSLDAQRSAEKPMVLLD